MLRMPPMRPVVFFLLLAGHGLLAWHALYGKRSLAYQEEVRRKLELAKTEYAEVQKRRADMERKVARLRDDTLDLDTLDEEARKQLGFIAPDEILALPESRR
jgi:cell division protein FtsB